MPLSQLDPSPALILIDLQKMAVGLTTAHPHSVERIFPRIGETTTTGQVLNQLREAEAAGLLPAVESK
jgi:hypothetical protein